MIMGLQSYNIYDEFYWEDIRKLKRHEIISPSEQFTEHLNSLKKRYIEEYWGKSLLMAYCEDYILI